MANRTAVIETNKGTIRVELLEVGRAEDDRELHYVGRKRILRRHHFSSRDQRLHDPGRRSDRHRRGGESAWGGRFDDEIDPQSQVYQTGYKAGRWRWRMLVQTQMDRSFSSCTSIIRCRRAIRSLGA